MGVADAMGPLSSAVSGNPVVAALMPFFVFIAFALCSVPGGLLGARIGKKNLMLLGLALNTGAVAVPAFINPPFVLLLACILLLGVGTTFLQVAGNPIMRDISPPGAFSRNLALAQGIKGIGSTTMTILATAGISLAFLPVLEKMGWRGVFPIFFVLMALAFVSVSVLKVQESKADVPPSVASSLALLGTPVFAFAVLGIFLYVGAEVCMTTFLKPAMEGLGFAPDAAGWAGPVLFLGALTLGRILAGSVKVSPHAFFRLSAFLGLAGLVLLMTRVKELALAGVVCGGLGFANIWPMLFSITVEEKPQCANELSGLMCMAISGGALVPLLMGKVISHGLKQLEADKSWVTTDGTWLTLAFVVPAICFLYLLLLSIIKGGRKSAPAPANPHS